MSPDDRHDRDHELGPEERAALDAWTVPDAPEGFADRVMRARASAPEAPAVPRRSNAAMWRGLAVAGVAVAALTLWQLRGDRGSVSATGSAAPAARQSIQLGRRGVAVAEAGANLSWTVDGGGAVIAQSA